MPVTERWRVGEEGVGAFDAWCVARRWSMVRVPTERDIGIDGFVQVTDDEGRPTGDVFAVQVKSGASYLRATGGAAPVDDHRELWTHSSSPVIAVVHDPATGAMWWSNASDALDHDPNLTTVAVTTPLPAADQSAMPLLRSVRLQADFRFGVPRGIGSTDLDEQVAAAWQSLMLGVRSSHALIALRRVLVSLDPVARVHAVEALAHCTPHPDIFWTKDTLLPRAVRDEVCATFRWRLDELAALLEVIDENGIDRGSTGQSMYPRHNNNRRPTDDRVHREAATRDAMGVSPLGHAAMGSHPRSGWRHAVVRIDNRSRVPLGEARLGDRDVGISWSEGRSWCGQPPRSTPSASARCRP